MDILSYKIECCMRKTIVSLLFCFLFNSCLTTFSQEPNIANPHVIRLVNEGIDFHKNKDYSNAISSFKEALEIEPDNALVRENLSIAHNNLGKYLAERTDYENALQEFRLAIYFDDNNKTAHSNLDALLESQGVKANDPDARKQIGDRLRQEGDFEVALVEYKKALGLSNETNPNILISIGDIYYILYLKGGQKSADIQKAVDLYKKALETKESAKAHIKLGDALLGLRDVSSAISHYKKALTLEPDSPDVLTANIRGWNEAVRLAPLVPENHIGLAQALQFKKDFIQSEEEYNLALKLDPENQIALQGIDSLEKDKLSFQASKFSSEALKLQEAKKYDQAIAEYVKALEIAPNDSNLHYNIGTCFQSKGDFEHAETAYKKSLEVDIKNEKTKTALENLNIEIKSKKSKDLVGRAIELQNAGNYTEAITTYLAALGLNDTDPTLHYNLGTAYQASGDLTKAQEEYKKAYELDKTNQVYLNALNLLKIDLAKPLVQSAVNKQTTNDILGAISDYSKALELVPNDPQVHFNLATAYQAANQFDNAVMSYLKAGETDPKGQADAFFFLGIIYEERKNNNLAVTYYEKYLQNAPAGSYAQDAKDRKNFLKKI